jgi:aminomethyltransferase
VTSASYSRLLMQSLAMVHLRPTHAQIGTRLTIAHGDKPLEALVVRTPFYDPLRQRTHPERQR